MALNAATLNAIQKAQLGFDQGVQAGSGFSQAFDTAYKAKVEKLAKRAENEKLGVFSSVATENILKPAKNKLFDVTNIQSKVDQELMEREVGREMSSKMKPLADANLYLQGLIKSNADVSFSNSLSDELIELNGKQYNKKEFLQALGTNHTAKNLDTISFKFKNENIDLPISKLKEEQFKYGNINSETLADHDTAMNRFTTSARQSNFAGAQVDNMVNQFLINQPNSVKRDLAYNYYQKDEDDKNKDVETFLKERMKSKIQSGYAYKQPEVEEEDDASIGIQYYNLLKGNLTDEAKLLPFLSSFGIREGADIDDGTIKSVERTEDGIKVTLEEDGKTKEVTQNSTELLDLILNNLNLTTSQAQQLQLKLFQEPIQLGKFKEKTSNLPTSTFLQRMQKAIGFGN